MKAWHISVWINHHNLRTISCCFKLYTVRRVMLVSDGPIIWLKTEIWKLSTCQWCWFLKLTGCLARKWFFRAELIVFAPAFWESYKEDKLCRERRYVLLCFRVFFLDNNERNWPCQLKESVFTSTDKRRKEILPQLWNVVTFDLAIICSTIICFSFIVFTFEWRNLSVSVFFF